MYERITDTRVYIEHGELEAESQGEDVKREWLVSVDSLHTLRASRPETVTGPRDDREADLADGIAGTLRGLAGGKTHPTPRRPSGGNLAAPGGRSVFGPAHPRTGGLKGPRDGRREDGSDRAPPGHGGPPGGPEEVSFVVAEATRHRARE